MGGGISTSSSGGSSSAENGAHGGTEGGWGVQHFYLSDEWEQWSLHNHATKMTDNPFADFAFDGVFGLALPGLSQTSDFNLATRLTKDLPSGMQAFSYYFNHKVD